jgi:hypothetical protein
MRIHHALSAVHAVAFRTASHRFIRSSAPTTALKDLLRALDVQPPKLILAAEPLADAPATT